MKRMVTLWYDDDGGALSDVKFSEAFLGESALMKADVLQDAVGVLTEAYEAAAEAMRKDYEAVALMARSDSGQKH